MQRRTATTAVAVLVLLPSPLCSSAPLLMLPLVVSVVALATPNTMLVVSASAVKAVDGARAVGVVTRPSGLYDVVTLGSVPASATPPATVFVAPSLGVPAATPTPVA